MCKHVAEWCPYCETEVQLKAELAVQECPNCGMYIVACSMCEDMHCDDCPLDQQANDMNK